MDIYRVCDDYLFYAVVESIFEIEQEMHTLLYSVNVELLLCGLITLLLLYKTSFRV